MSFLTRWAWLALLVSVPSLATAQDTSGRSVARSLFHEGVACLDASDFACAADRFRRSNQLRPSPVVVYNLAAAEEALGHVAIASELFLGLSRDAQASDEVREAAEAKHRQLQPRVAFAVIRVDALRDAELRLDEQPFPAQAIGVRTPVDPGSHTVRAVRDGGVVAEVTFEAASGEATEISLEIPTERATPAEAPAATAPTVLVPPVIAPPDSPPPASPPPLDETSTRPNHRGRRVALVLTALAVVGGGIALGIVLSRDDAPQAIPGTAGTREIGR